MSLTLQQKRQLAQQVSAVEMPNANPMSLTEFKAIQDKVYLLSQGNVPLDSCSGSNGTYTYGLPTPAVNLVNATPANYDFKMYSSGLHSDQGGMHNHGGVYPQYQSAYMQNGVEEGYQGAFCSESSRIMQPLLGQPQPAYTTQIQQFYAPQTALGWTGCGGPSQNLSPFGGIAPPLRSAYKH